MLGLLWRVCFGIDIGISCWLFLRRGCTILFVHRCVIFATSGLALLAWDALHLYFIWLIYTRNQKSDEDKDRLT